MIVNGSSIDVQWYEEPDLAALQHVHKVCLPYETWKKQDFVNFADRPGQLVYKIVKDDVEVIGSLLISMGPDDARVRRVCVLPEYRRKKIGSMAVQSLLGSNSPTRRNMFTARVREHDVVSQLFLKSLNFRKTETSFGKLEIPEKTVDTLGLPRRKEGVFEDAYWFRLEMPDQARRRRAAVQPVFMP